MIPFSNHPVYRCLWGWLGAPEVTLPCSSSNPTPHPHPHPNPHLSPFTLTPTLTPNLTLILTPIRCDIIRGLCAWYFPARIGAGDLGRQAALSLPVPRPRRISRDLARGRARASARLRCAVAVRRRLQLLARALKLALTPLTLTLSLTRCAADCSFSPEQLEAVISATFASAELDSDGRIRRHSLKALYRELL